MDTPTFVRVIVAISFLACAGCVASDHAPAVGLPPLPFAIDSATSASDRPVRSFGPPYRGPVFDTHTHLDPNDRHEVSDSGTVTLAMKMANVRRLVLLPTPNADRTREIGLALRQMDFLRQNSYGAVMVMCGSFVDYLRDLKSGACNGVGEIGFRHYIKAPGELLIDLPFGYPPLLAIAETAGRLNVPLDLHAEPVEPNGTRHDAEVFGTISLMFERSPNLRLILAHTAMTNVHNARALLVAFPTLMMNINFATHKGGMWRNLEAVSHDRGQLYSDWAALFEEMPDRFMVGSDMFFSRVSDPVEAYQRHIRNVRRCLGSLAPDAARRIAYENAERVFGPPPR